ncbi:hypothetical protein HanRHA438_Chr04g0194871 [Helianthus annuus]|nr:hypothetical protein HanRHA438_Chr04g0194871 [Helianthus annuus]
MDQVVTLSPTQNPLGLSLLTALHTYHWLCNPMVISFSLIATYQGLLYILTTFSNVCTYSLTHELAQLYVDFSNYMYFRKLTDLARYARIFKLRLNKEVIQGLEGVASSWTGYISLNLVLFKVFC